MADAVLHRPLQVVELPIRALAREVGVGASVISRFSRKVDLPSFRALRLALAHELGTEAAAAGRNGTGEASSKHGSAWDAARASILADVAALLRNLEPLEPEALTAAAMLLAKAPRVVAVGYDTSGTVAKRLASMLVRHGWRARAEVAPTDITWTQDIDPEDVVVAISHRGHAAQLMAALPDVRARGARLLAITNAPDGPIARAADVVLATCVPGDTSDDAYVLDPVLPVQLVTARALVAAAVAV